MKELEDYYSAINQTKEAKRALDSYRLKLAEAIRKKIRRKFSSNKIDVRYDGSIVSWKRDGLFVSSLPCSNSVQIMLKDMREFQLVHLIDICSFKDVDEVVDKFIETCKKIKQNKKEMKERERRWKIKQRKEKEKAKTTRALLRENEKLRKQLKAKA